MFRFRPDCTVFPWSSELGHAVFWEKFPHYSVFLNDGVPYDGGGDVYHDDGDHDKETFEMLEKDFCFYSLTGPCFFCSMKRA